MFFTIRPYRPWPMRYAFLLPLCALAVLATGIPSAIGQPLILPPYMFSGGADYIFVQGTWIGDTPDRSSYWRDFSLQTSEINCHRVRKTCLEARAAWYKDMMFAYLLEYNIREWDEDKVVAVDDGRVATIELRVDIKKQVVLLTRTEKPELPNASKLPEYAHLDDGMKAIENAKGK